jgi:hypothetical protein
MTLAVGQYHRETLALASITWRVMELQRRLHYRPEQT